MQFHNAEQAIRWAYEISSRPIVKTSSINTMRGAETRSNAELTPYDQHAQAAMILSLCERVLPDLHMAYVKVQFGRERSGFEMLSKHIAAQFGTGLHSRRGIEQIIRSYCGEKGGLREIKRMMQCGTLKAAYLRERGFDALDRLHVQTMDAVWREMNVAEHVALA
ncbi:MAG: hypothetical protein ABS69_10690 [Nitrosomonadales bacterium SCN 54-20]|nr:MAG: hypothetical protein ABS69_10690 [Nitrosomonadales bacterium SCN 54-20]